MIAAGLLLLVGLALWTFSPGPIVIAMCAILMLSIRATAGNRLRELFTLLATFVLSFILILSIDRDMAVYDGSPKFFGRLALAAIFALAIAAMLAACAYFLEARANMKPEKTTIAHVVAPVAMLVPQLFTATGNTYRRRFLLAFIVFGVCFGLIIAIRALAS